jgi:tRNA 2-selenouridine synthase
MPQPEVIETVEPASLSRFDMIIDVRSPAEFEEDHIPGAINLPVLDNEERAKVGTIYVQESRFRARKIGAAMVAHNVARHLETALADQPGSFHPLIYCWRGGQRSNSMATILSQIGWRTAVLSGGYRTYRRRVQHRLYEEEIPFNLVLIDGQTGCGKTAVLQRLLDLGIQTIDLEGIAEHRGSLFGGFSDRRQPSQKLFESRLLAAIEALDLSQPIAVEAESSKVGVRVVPPALWARMLDAPRIELLASRPARVRYLVENYADIIADRAALERAVARLPVHPGRKRIEEWKALADAGDFAALADAVVERHYDPSYERSRRLDQRPILGSVQLSSLDQNDIGQAAASAASIIREKLGAIPLRYSG